MSLEPPFERLPRGPHGLSRESVAASQRARMLAAMVDAVSEKGYVRVVVADVIRGAGVSRAAFYEQFTDIEDCFLAAYEANVARLRSRLDGARRAEHEPEAGAAAELIDTYLDAIAEDPKAARVFLIDVYGAGPAVLTRRFDVLARFVDVLASLTVGAAGWPEDAPARRLRAEAVVGAISSMVTSRIAAGRPDLIAEIREPALALAGLSPGPQTKSPAS